MRLAALVALAACGKSHEPALDKEAARSVFEEVPIVAPPGISDLTIDDRGVLWAIPERDRAVVELDLGKPPASPGSAGARSNADAVRSVIVHPLEGVAPGIDTEAIAWLGDGKFAIGTEGANEPTAAIMFAQLQGQALVVERTRTLTSQDLGVMLTKNHGIEALCAAGDEILAATESVGTFPDGTRYAALARLRGDALSVAKLRLTTTKGKISAMYCTLVADGSVQVTALERHYSVCRILEFTVKRDDVEIRPTVALDLAPILHDSLNLEGIVRLRDGRLAAINDNQGSTVRGPTELLVFARR
jgi:phytase-like protein